MQNARSPSNSVSAICTAHGAGGSNAQSGAQPIFCIFTARTRTLPTPHGSTCKISPS